MLGGNAVEHAGGVESPHHLTRPALALQEPAQDNGKNLVRIHEAAVFSHCAQAVGITIGGKAGMALLANYDLLQQAHVRLDRLGINPWEKRIHLATHFNKRNSMLAEDASQHAP